MVARDRIRRKSQRAEDQPISTVECVGVEERFRLYGISWQTYLELRDAPENEHVHMTYDQGELEMMSPSKDA